MTSKLRIVTFQPEHLAALPLRDAQAGELPSEILGPAVSVLLEDRPIAIVGWHFITASVIQIWALVSERVSERKIAFHKSIRELIEYAFSAHPILRMQISVRVGFMAGWSWARSLGFKCEGVMRSYGPDGADYWLFARVRA